MLYEVAAAGPSGCGPGATSAKHRDLHAPSLADHRMDGKGDASRGRTDPKTFSPPTPMLVEAMSRRVSGSCRSRSWPRHTRECANVATGSRARCHLADRAELADAEKLFDVGRYTDLSDTVVRVRAALSEAR